MQRQGLAAQKFGGICSQPYRAGLTVCACPLPRCKIERNAEGCRADPTRSARWPARVNLEAFWQQIAPNVPFLPTLPTVKHCAVCYLQIAVHLDTEEVAGSNPAVPTIIIRKQITYTLYLFSSPLIMVRSGSISSSHAGLESDGLRFSPFFGHSLLVDSCGRHRVCMP